jgi:hypothetical protein
VATLAPPLHLASNVAGVVWLDEATWIALAIVYALVAHTVLRDPMPAPPPTPAARVRAEAC